MIKYNLLCKKCDLNFDSWFASSKEYEKLKRKRLLNCHSCGSLRVEKNLMAPKLINKSLSQKNENMTKKKSQTGQLGTQKSHKKGSIRVRADSNGPFFMRFLCAQIAGFLIFFSTKKCRISDCLKGIK